MCLLDLLEGSLFTNLAVLVLLRTLEELLRDNDTFCTARSLQGCILRIAGLVAEDGTEQLLFRSRIRLALRRDLTDEDIAFADVSTDTDETVLVEILGGCLLYTSPSPRDS